MGRSVALSSSEIDGIPIEFPVGHRFRFDFFLVAFVVRL